MKKLLSFLTIAMIAVQLMAAPVDVSTARVKAQQYLAQKVYAGKYMAPGATDAKLIKTEMGDKAHAPVYYIFNTATTFVIVSGDDRAEEILAVGDKPLDIDRIPSNMQAWLDNYKQQLDWLLTNPDAKVDKPTAIKSPKLKGSYSIGPLLTALWHQGTPYNDQCHFTYNGTTYECYTGCAATSASMVLYYWKYPTHQVGPIPSYTTTLDLGEYNSVTYTYPALPAVTFDWDNMIDDYTSPMATDYTPEQAAAVATLMRYVGQKEHMMYGTEGSGIFTSDTQVIADMYIDFGYDATICRFVRKSDYSEEQWAQMVQEEIIEHRPVVYCGVDAGGAGGHAFNVDGYNPDLNKYHVNFGWSGNGNNWYVMNAFSARDYTFSENQRMVLGIQPPTGRIIANPWEVAFNGFDGETYTEVVKVNAVNIESDITVSLTGSECYSINATTITPEQAANGYDVTVTYAPTQAGSSEATLTLSCADEDVQAVTVPIVGEAMPRVPTLLVDSASLTFTTTKSQPLTKTIALTGAFLTNDVTVTLNDENGVFSVSPSSIPQSNTGVNSPVAVAVTFNSPVEGDYNGTLTFSSANAESKTIQLTGKIVNGGSATDRYLDLAKYETINDAGWNVSDIQNLYHYTEYEDLDCAWLTVSNYGVIMSSSTQEWFSNSINTTYGTNWNPTDIFLGSSSYFGSAGSYAADWNGLNQYFYVTNCTRVKQYAFNRSSTYPLIMRIYECSLNPDGSVTAGATPVDTKQSSVYNTTEVITSSELDAAKIYMVQIYNDYSYLYEIGFQTPLNSIETPIATTATEVKANGFTANWTVCPSAANYTLRVMPKPAATLLMTETFPSCISAGSLDVGNNLDNYLDNPGWTGSKLYTAVGGLRFGTGSSTGYLTSPTLDLSNYNKVSAIIKAKTFNNDTNCDLKVSCGDASETITLPDNNEAEYTIVLDCTAADQNVKFENTTKGKRVIITSIELYSGDITKPAKGLGETIFTGITDLSYAVTGLLPGTTYLYDVKAVNGTIEGKWSNKIEVLTLTGGIPGDVDGDGVVTSYDVTLLYNNILTGDTTDIVNGDQDGDGSITSSDITLVYNILLGN